MQTKITLLLEQFLLDFLQFLKAFASQENKIESTANTFYLSYLIVFKANVSQVILRDLRLNNSCLLWQARVLCI